MARPLRLVFSGALYHVTSRGDRHEDIYINDDDRVEWLALLGRVCKRFNCVCHAYCLMDNHYHLLIETIEGNLSQGMRPLNGVYTQTFNRTHNRVGHVFQGRYKGILVDKESYLLELARYVVLNPVRASIVKKPESWPWSSYHGMMKKTNGPDWLETDVILSHFSKQRRTAQTKYREFVYQGRGLPSVWQQLKSQIYLGPDKFVEKLKKRIGDEQDLTEIPRAQRRALAKSLSDYERKHRHPKDAMVEAYRTGDYSLKQIADHFGVHYATVSRAIKAFENLE